MRGAKAWVKTSRTNIHSSTYPPGAACASGIRGSILLYSLKDGRIRRDHQEERQLPLVVRIRLVANYLHDYKWKTILIELREGSEPPRIFPWPLKKWSSLPNWRMRSCSLSFSKLLLVTGNAEKSLIKDGGSWRNGGTDWTNYSGPRLFDWKAEFHNYKNRVDIPRIGLLL